MAVWLSLNRDYFIDTDKLFVRCGEEGTTAHNYADALRDMLYNYHDMILSMGARADKTRPHGFRKGSGTASCSSTTATPSLPAVANRGEWSQGTVFNIYLQFAAAGDHYLGRLLAMLNPHDPLFSVLPPHFAEGLENEDIKAFLHLCFGSMMGIYGESASIVPCLLFFAASLAYHSNEFKAVAAPHSNHFFNTLPMFSNPELLERVKLLVTLEPTDMVRFSTGVHPGCVLPLNARDLDYDDDSSLPPLLDLDPSDEEDDDDDKE